MTHSPVSYRARWACTCTSRRSKKAKKKTAGASKQAAPAAPARKGTQDRAVADALKAAKLVTQRQIDRGVREVKAVGASMADILIREIGDEKLRRALDKEVMYSGARRPLRDVLTEALGPDLTFEVKDNTIVIKKR